MRNTITRKCKFCGNNIKLESKKEIDGKQYCNIQCRSNDRKVYKEINCLGCNEKMILENHLVGFIKFCSDQCIHNYNLNNKQQYKEYSCIVCNNKIWNKVGVKGTKYCSGKCKGKDSFEKFKVVKNCLQCNKEYEAHRNRADASKFCSVSCSSKYNSKQQGFGIIIKPEVVWNKGLTSENDIRIKNMSIKRQSTWMKNYKAGKFTMYFSGKNLTEVHKKNISMGTSRALSEYGRGFIYGKFEDLHHVTRSSWEVNFARILKYLNIDYEYEPSIFELSNNKSYIPDFYDKKKNKFYEVKGFIKPDYLDKFNLFKQNYPDQKIVLIDDKFYKKLIRKFKNYIQIEQPKKYKARKKVG